MSEFSSVSTMWVLLGAALVFFMQAGFAMVEAGFTRAKNAGNIIMKNLMDFCIGTAVFILFGYGIMNSSSYIGGFIGRPEYGMFTDFGQISFSSLCSVLPVQLLYQVQWQREPNSACTVYIQQL